MATTNTVNATATVKFVVNEKGNSPGWTSRRQMVGHRFSVGLVRNRWL